MNINRVDEFPTGVYRYLPYHNRLVQLEENKNISLLLASACLGHKNFSRLCRIFYLDYRERAKPLEVPAASLSLHPSRRPVMFAKISILPAKLWDLVVALAAFDDDAVNEIICVDGKEEFVMI